MVTRKLTSNASHFWWSSDGQRRGMHWISWDKLCRNKAEGGLGFRDLNDFNTALLAKQLWRLIDYPESLFSKVFKGRYYRNATPLDMVRSFSPSYGWQSITSARSLVQKGLIKRVGSGHSISVWNDPWIPSSCPRPATGRGSLYYPDLMVSQLIDPLTSMWNWPLITQLIDHADIPFIHGLPTTTENRPDVLGWGFTKSGRYTVKSGYDIARKNLSRGSGSTYYGPDVSTLQAHSWKIQCPPKMKHFIWQIISGCLAVHDRLNSRGIRCEPVCQRCGSVAETINHTLFECPPALQAWALSPIPTPPGQFPLDALFSNMSHLFWHLPKNEHMTIYPWLLWYIWKARNDKEFSNIERDPQEVLRLAEAEAKAWYLAQFNNEDNGHLMADSGIIEGMVYPDMVCQIDGSWKETNNQAGLGWYCFSAGTGEIIMGARNLHRSLSPLHTEMEALIWGMHSMIDNNKLAVAFATDCLELVRMVSKPDEWPAFAIYLEEFERSKREFTSFTLSHIPRAQNTKADTLSRSARDYLHHVEYVNSIPPVWISKPF